MVRGQFKIQQTIFMLLAVTLFFVFVGLLVVGFKFASVKDSATLLKEKNALLLVSKLADSPEFSCGNSFGGSRTNCIDSDKIMMLKANIGAYSNFWGVDNIEVRMIYPKSNQDILCTLQNYPDCNIIRLLSDEIKGYSVSNFVALCRKESLGDDPYNKCELARLIVSYEAK